VIDTENTCAVIAQADIATRMDETKKTGELVREGVPA
jgi:hypothetical protein